MKPLLIILIITLLAGCANNQREAIENICKGVETTGKTCSSAVGLARKCADCSISKQNAEFENATKADISTFELQENSMLW
jgi:hypothetical protein